MSRQLVTLKRLFTACCLPALLLAVCGLSAAAERDSVPAAGDIDYNRVIQPILSDNCYHCHGPDAAQRKAGLRLDQQDSALAVRDGQAAIVPGSVERSELLQRIFSADPDEQMPPPDSNRHLSEQQKSVLKQWIESGASWGTHWAFVTPQRPALPAVTDEAWCRNPIDRFILARLDREGLRPSPEASKETLIRRATLDLTGLPPTPQEVDALLTDASPDAYERVVDRLLASTKYGERMVIEWLDAARYADTNGYQGDPTRTMWPWRDWVIEAMNANMPFDEFVIEQLAGDLLPNATQKQRLASGFNRNHTYNGEGGRIAEETRVENVFDRVETTGTVFLGLTFNCTRCHDHKYDPLTQAEYYQLYAYFNQSSETGAYPQVNGNALPVMSIVTAEQEQKLAELRKAQNDAAIELNAITAQVDAEQVEWEKKLAGVADSGTVQWAQVTPVSVASQNGVTFTTLEDKSVLAGGENPLTDVHEVVIRTEQTGITGFRVEALPHESLPHSGPGRSLDTGNFVLTYIEVEAARSDSPSETNKVTLASASATYEQSGELKAVGALDPSPDNGWAVWQAPDKNNLSATFGFAEPVGFPGGTELRLKLRYESSHKNHTMGRFRLSLTSSPAVTLPPEVAAALAVASEQRNDQQKQLVRDHYRKDVSELYKTRSATADAAKKAANDYDNSLTKVMVMDDATLRETHILKRGGYDQPGEKVEPGVPAILNPLPDGAPNNRLGLARWLADPANPLLARVTVNRYWQTFFGTGIVKTSEDFGVQGEKPVHPDLLDWLAVEFRESGWNVKALHRLIVTSAAYRQSSRVTPKLVERDPENRLLARGPRYRLSSFVIRDQALAISGLLVDQIGGPPVKGYQPPGVWEEMSLDQIKYEQDHGDALWRRSIYTFWRRTVHPTTMFDVPLRTVCTVRQPRTNTPLHALALLNDVTYVEAARNLAEKLLLDESRDEQQKLQRAFRLAMARPPKEAEEQILTAALRRLREQYRADPAAAEKLVTMGEKPRDPSVAPPELAAWTSLVSLILNLDETITKE